MGKTEGEILAMPAHEYESWIEHHNRIPFSSERLEILMAQLLALTANINKVETREPYTVMDFLPWLGEPILGVAAPPGESTMQTMQEMREINISLAVFKGKLERVQ